MNAVLNELITATATDDATLESALANCGWERSCGARWSLQTENGECVLEELAHRDRWRQFQLSGGAAPQTDSSRVLEDNDRLFGPAKLIARPDGRTVCRIDVPDELGGGTEHSFGADGNLQLVNACSLWATAVTVCATGDRETRCAKAVAEDDLNRLVDELKQAGWSTSLDGDQLQIHIQLPGVYRQVVLECHERADVRLATELIQLAEVDKDCVRAVKYFANAINARLPLVRLAFSKSNSAICVRAELGFGATIISGTYLLMSLHALESAISLSVRELEALRDPELARLLLAVAAARDSNV